MPHKFKIGAPIRINSPLIQLLNIRPNKFVPIFNTQNTNF